jgi:hypothetical protein
MKKNSYNYKESQRHTVGCSFKSGREYALKWEKRGQKTIWAEKVIELPL